MCVQYSVLKYPPGFDGNDKPQNFAQFTAWGWGFFLMEAQFAKLKIYTLREVGWFHFQEQDYDALKRANPKLSSLSKAGRFLLPLQVEFQLDKERFAPSCWSPIIRGFRLGPGPAGLQYPDQSLLLIGLLFLEEESFHPSSAPPHPNTCL